jgi:hypothetical protein
MTEAGRIRGVIEAHCVNDDAACEHASKELAANEQGEVWAGARRVAVIFGQKIQAAAIAAASVLSSPVCAVLATS